MKKVSISKVKAELSKFIRMVVQGETVVILDRDRPVAMLTAILADEKVEILEAKKNAKAFFKALSTETYELDTDILQVLDDERSDRL